MKYLAGTILLLPNSLGSLVLGRQLLGLQPQDPVQLAFLVGMGVYGVMHLLLWKPIFMHVMGHELTHAFWAWLLGGRIKSLQVSESGGQVTLSKTNFFIALAPYFFPFYTFLLVPVYFISIPVFHPLLALAMGFTLAFHIALTLHSLREHQSDIREVGVFFSFSFVYLMNLIVLVAVFSIIAPNLISPWRFLTETYLQGYRLWEWLLRAWGG